MKIDYENSTYEFDITRLSTYECEEIEKFTAARGLGDWSNQLAVAKTKALKALWWALRRHAGQDPGPIARDDPEFFPVAFSKAYSEAEAAEFAAHAAAEAAEAEPDPTLEGSSPRHAATLTSPVGAPPTQYLPG